MTRSRGIRPPQPRWTPEEDATLRKLVAAGMSSRIIAQRMVGKSHNSVIGRCHRLRMQLNAKSSSGGKKAALNTARDKAVRKAKAAKAAGGRGNHARSRNGGMVATAMARASAPPAPKLPKMPPGAARVSIIDLTSQHCRYIGDRPEIIAMDTPLYCGEPAVEGGSWCGTHRPLLLVKPRPRV